MPDRREFFRGALAAGAASEIAAGEPPAPSAFAGMIPREINPPNLETHPSQLREEITPTDVFYVRNHFPTPKIDRDTWRLRIEGAVDKPLSLSWDEIERLPAVARKLTMECAGNSRVFLTPKVRGVNWANGAVGNAEWRGVTLATVLDLAGVRKSAEDVILEGADAGAVIDEPKSPGPIAYARSLPIEKARKPEVILAHAMNGQPLTPDHGWPLRAVVGGWYGMASVKWLTRIIVTETPFQGFWQTMDYSEFVRINGTPTLKPITAMRVKAIILTPPTPFPPKSLYGVAWAGEHAVAKVEVSIDGGKNWQAAQLARKAEPFQWVHWTCDNMQFSGHPLAEMVRATDTAGNVQPMQRDPDRRTYQINHVIPLERRR